MGLKRKVNWALVCKSAWIASSMSILMLGLGSCFADAVNCGSAESVFLPFMVLLSFPSGLIAMLFVYCVVDSGTPEAYVTLWSSMFVAGYFQWFVLVANANQPLQTLGLSTAIEPGRAIPESTHPIAKTPRKRRQRPVLAFDRKGRTPLERAIESRKGLG